MEAGPESEKHEKIEDKMMGYYHIEVRVLDEKIEEWDQIIHHIEDRILDERAGDGDCDWIT